MNINTLLFSFLFFIQIGSQEEMADYYIESINSNVITAEIAWGITTHYYSLNSELQNSLHERINNDFVRAALNERSQKAALLYLNEYMADEELLFLNLLLESEAHIRKQLFTKYYSSRTKDSELYKINLEAQNGVPINDNITDFHFYHFLAAFYTKTNKVVDKKFYSSFLDVWGDKTDQVKDEKAKDFLLATIVKSADETNQFEYIAALYEELLNIKHLPSSYIKRDFYWTIDYAFYRLGEINKSLEIQRKFSIPISQYLRDESSLAFIQASMGGYLYLLGKYQEAREVFLTTLKNSDQLSEAILTRLYNNLSLTYFKTGESSKYIEIQVQALEHAETVENYRHQISIYRNLHIFYRKNQNWNLAQTYIQMAADLALETDNLSDLVSIYVSEAVYEDQFQDNRDAAYEKLEHARQILSDETEPRLLIRVLNEKSKLLMKDGKWAESKSLHEQILSESAAQADPSTYLESIITLAKIELLQGNHSEADKLLKEYKAHDVTVLDFHLLIAAQTLQAQLADINGRYYEANTLFESAADLVLERARNTSELETGYWSVEPEYLYLFETYADFLISRQKHAEAITLLDQFKTINDASLVENPLVKSSVLTEEELAMERQITRQMDTVRKKIFNTSDEEKLALQNELESLSAQKRELTKNLNVHHESTPPNIWRIQRSLKPGEQVLHITELGNNYYLSLLSHNTTEVNKLRITAETNNLFEESVASVVRGRTNLDLLYEAGKFINIHSFSDFTQSLIIIPDGYFHQLPVDIIPLQKPDSPFSYGSATYTIEQMDVRHLNRLSDITRRSANHSSYASDYTGFGIEDFDNEHRAKSLVSLPKAPDEVKNIAANLNRLQTRQTFLNKNATPYQFKSSAGNSRILHLATHSEVSESDPLFSRLHLSAEPSGNLENEVTTHLFAYELFDLNMQNELVMLNSCESGGGRFLQGSGIMGISRALRYAGANSLVLNAWSVNDQFAADFATRFYKYLNDGETKSRALQLTKIHFIKERNANPHFWGPYMLNGDNRPLLSREHNRAGIILLAGVFIAGFLSLRHKNSEAA